MNRGRRQVARPPGPTRSPLEQQATRAKQNRLSRSFRQTQQSQTAEVDSPENQKPDFKTPTRISRPGVVPGFCGESPHNESDFQQDIIWDATSPSPNRAGKRGKKHPAGAVDISEIVSRIAPKHGRPRVAEPTLQQWIGDSATIPCTPDVQVPKPKKKSPRPNRVDDLLKLAKQFDFNMFRQEEEEEEVEDDHQRSLELLSDDIFASPPGNCGAALSAAAGTDVQEHPDPHMEDDLDFLFDGPTQHVSGNLSQASSAQPSQFKPPPAPGKPSSCAYTTNAKGPSANDEFEDDWENDDLLNDSLVFEMTQNPQKFVAPQHCSTQKPASEVTCGGVRLDQSAASKVETARQRATFKLESNPNFCVKRNQADTWTSRKVDSSSRTAGVDHQQSSFSSRKGFSVEAGSQTQFYQRTRSASSTSAVTQTVQSFPKEPDVVSSSDTAPAACDFLDEDLDSFFSSDLVWDDPADDDLLCELCDDVENQIHNAGNRSVKQTLPDAQVSKQRAALKPSNRTWDNRTQQPALGHGGASTLPLPQKQAPTGLFCVPAGPAGSSWAAGSASRVPAGAQVNTLKDSFRYTQTKTALGPTSSSTCLQGSSRVQSAAAVPHPASRDQFTFKKPNNPVSTVSSTVRKCSAAEIELKKQHAMERRRQRLQAAQNLRAPT